jgi:carbamoyl-phosphate synthase large subunit
VIDVIQDGTVDGVVNTITGGHEPLRDGFHIRRASVERRTPCFTSLDTMRVAVDVLAFGGQIYSARPLPDYRNKPPLL